MNYQTKQNKTKQNKTKQNKTKQNKTKQNKTKQNKKERKKRYMKRILVSNANSETLRGMPIPLWSLMLLLDLPYLSARSVLNRGGKGYLYFISCVSKVEGKGMGGKERGRKGEGKGRGRRGEGEGKERGRRVEGEGKEREGKERGRVHSYIHIYFQ